MKRRNRINEQFAARDISMLESPAYRALSRSAHMVISRIEIELAHHGGNDNGRLPVTTDDFVSYGMHRSSVAPAIREAERLGFIRITERGRGGNAEHRAPNKFFLTFARGRDAHRRPPTHDWRRIKTLADAEQIARVARAAKDPIAVANGKRASEKRLQKQKTGTKISPVSVRKVRTEKEISQYEETVLQGRIKNPYDYLYLGEGKYVPALHSFETDTHTPETIRDDDSETV